MRVIFKIKFKFQAPWKLNKIWVQECIYDEFKLALSRKCNTKKSSGCSETKLSDNEFIIEGKHFLIDFSEDILNTEKTNHHTVLVEAYRTNKELISLLNTKDYFLSLWASDISEANEIVYSIATPVVWINDYGCFYGPPKASQAIFSDVSIQRDEYLKHSHWLFKEDFKELNDRLDKWKMLSYEKRKEIINNVLFKKAICDEIFQFIDDINQPDPYKFIDITDRKVCVGIDSVHDSVKYLDIDEDSLIAVCKALLHGNIYVICRQPIGYEFKNILDALFDVGVPILIDSVDSSLKRMDSDKVEIELISFYIYLLKTRVIMSNYGTIFAN